MDTHSQQDCTLLIAVHSKELYIWNKMDGRVFKVRHFHGLDCRIFEVEHALYYRYFIKQKLLVISTDSMKKHRIEDFVRDLLKMVDPLGPKATTTGVLQPNSVEMD